VSYLISEDDSGASIPSSSSASSDLLATIYCTDENLAVRLAGDFVLLTPKWQVLAEGTDGAFASNGRWTLTSASAAFDTSGAAAGSVVWLTKPTATFGGGGELIAVDSVTNATTLAVRRCGLTAGEGKPPGPVGGLSSISYKILTLRPQIEEASFEINRRYMIDPAWAGRQPSDCYDLRDLRQACVLTVAVQRIQAEVQNNSKYASWGAKLETYTQELGDVLARVRLRWTQDDRLVPGSPFNTRLIR